MTFYVKGAIESKWKNPFSVKKYGRSVALDKYKEYVLSNADLLNCINELKGKALGCWCRSFDNNTEEIICHGDILIDLLNSDK